MHNLIGYIFIAALMALLGAFFAISMRYDYRRIEKRVKMEIEKLEIICELIALDSEIKSTDTYKNAYLMQIDHFLRYDPFGIDKKKIAVCKPNSDSKVDQKIYKMYNNAPATVKGYMNTLSKLLGRIYQMNHPLKFKMLELKKNMERRFLLFLLKICCLLIKFLDACDEGKNKKRIKNLKKQQKKYKTYEKPVLLNGTSPEPVPMAA